ncbi:MAG: molybdopterin molybdotransferase MoeA [Candidatus Caldarchaeum sp.]|uniref:Molybdopterin molybdenumtransferase MoeA n=1 Tax=Caldiarchaeum subterraneum TaxID=311458 RepID=A0A7C5QE75_CALS0
MSRRKMSGFPALASVEEAFSMLVEKLTLQNPEVEYVGLEECLDRFCGQDVFSPADVPPFDRSAVDGYAVKAADTFGASPTNPVNMKLVGTSYTGMRKDIVPAISSGQAVEIYTGAPVPEGADAVVMAEYCKKTGDGYVEVFRQVHPLQNVSRTGEDFRMGELVVGRGTRIKSWHIGALASLNIVKIPVYKKLHVSVLSTGSELVEPGQPPREDQIVNSSKPMLKSLIQESGCIPVDLGTVEDDVNLVASKIAEGVKLSDIVIVTGGTSIGERDIVPDAVNKAGKPGVVFHGVRIRPAKPTGAGIVEGKPVFMLSGFPVSALIGFQLFVKPVIDMMYSHMGMGPCLVRGRLTRRVANHTASRLFVRVRVEKTLNGFVVEPLMLTGSGLLSTLTKANALLVVPEEVEGYDEGQMVEVQLLQHD